MKDAILLIATGNYQELARALIESIDTYLVDESVELFVFSDSPDFASARFPCHVSTTSHAFWPRVTVDRFATLLSVRDRLASFDRLLYMDSDLEIVAPLRLDELLLPGKIAAIDHPARYLKGPHYWDVETRPESTACLPATPSGIYYQGCLWGGDSELILSMVATLHEQTESDARRGITAKWYDESHLNHYLFHHPELCAAIPPAFAYPEKWDLPFPRRILHRWKEPAVYPSFTGDAPKDTPRKLVIKEHTILANDLEDHALRVIDLGACLGEFTLALSKMFPVEQAVLVEANPTNFKQIEPQPNLQIFHRVVTGLPCTGPVTFLEDTRSPYNGSVRFDYFKESMQVHQVAPITLSELLGYFPTDREIDLLKVDIEGAEYELLANTPEEDLKRFRQITVEFHDFLDPRLRLRNAAIVRKLRRLGFSVIHSGTDYKHGSKYYDTLFYKKEKQPLLRRLLACLKG